MPSVLTSHALERNQLLRALEKQKHEFQALWKEKERLASVVESKEAEALRLCRFADSKSKLAEQAQRTSEALAAELKASHQKAAEACEQRRQLEHKVSVGQAPKIMAEKHARLKLKLSSTVSGADACARALEACQQELQRSQAEVSVLLKALEVRLHESGPAARMPPPPPAPAATGVGHRALGLDDHVFSTALGGNGGWVRNGGWEGGDGDDGRGSGGRYGSSGGGGGGVTASGAYDGSGGVGSSLGSRGIYNLRSSSAFYEKGGDEEDRQREVRASLLYELCKCREEVQRFEKQAQLTQGDFSKAREQHADLVARFASEQQQRQKGEAAIALLNSELKKEQQQLSTCREGLARAEDELSSTVAKVELLSERCERAEGTKVAVEDESRRTQEELRDQLENKKSELELIKEETAGLRKHSVQRSSVTDMAQQRLSVEKRAHAECRQALEKEASFHQATQQSLVAACRERDGLKTSAEELQSKVDTLRQEGLAVAAQKNKALLEVEGKSSALARCKVVGVRYSYTHTHTRETCLTKRSKLFS